MIVPDDLQPGDGLTLSYENAVLDAVRAGQVRTEDGGPLGAMVTGFGTFLQLLRKGEGWFKVGSQTSTSGSYRLAQVLDGPSNGWLAAPRAVVAREVNGNAMVDSGAYVRAWRGRAGWLFAYGKCS